MISSVKLNGEEKCSEVGTGHNIRDTTRFLQRYTNIFCNVMYGVDIPTMDWTGSPLMLSIASKNIFCQDVRMWERMEKLAKTMWEASQNQFLEKSA